MVKQQPEIKVSSRDEADGALKTMAEIDTKVAAGEAAANEKISEIKNKLVEEFGPVKKTFNRWKKALEKWATKNKDREFPEDSKTLELNFGKVYFKWTPYRIEFDIAEETVIERLRARKMESCIRVITEVNKEALENYPDKVLKEIGARRARDDKFHYELKTEDVKP